MRRAPQQSLAKMNPVNALSPQQLEQAFQVFNLKGAWGDVSPYIVVNSQSLSGS